MTAISKVKSRSTLLTSMEDWRTSNKYTAITKNHALHMRIKILSDKIAVSGSHSEHLVFHVHMFHFDTLKARDKRKMLLYNYLESYGISNHFGMTRHVSLLR